MTPARLILLPLLILLAGLGVTWAAWDHERDAARNEVLSQFDYAMGDAVSRIEQRMSSYEQILRGMQGMFVATGSVDREKFSDYVSAINLDANAAGIQAVGVIKWITARDKAAHVSAMRQLGIDGYVVWPDGEREQYAPIIQREPYDESYRMVLGVDSWATPARRLAMEKARDSGMATLSGKTQLIVDANTDEQPGFVMYLPLYAHGTSQDTVAERRAHLVGWVYASFRMREVIASLYGEQQPGLSFAIYDGVEPSKSALLYRSSDPSEQLPAPVVSANEYLVVNGHNWVLSMTADNDFKARFGRNAHTLIALTGSILSVLLALLSWVMVTGRSRAMRLATKMTRELKELAFFDALTRLPNRMLLAERLKEAIAASARSEVSGALLFIDVDNFKTLNDTLGHDKGDLLLQEVALRLSESVRKGDTVARVGGDEFVILLENLSPYRDEAIQQTELVGQAILNVLGGPYQLDGLEYRCTASIGATVFSGQQVTIKELLKQADLAMYRSKERGRNALCFFDPLMQAIVVERAALEAGLRKALDEDRFLLYYQAQVARDGSISGAEALVRWQHPERGIVAPADFIPLAEEAGLILALGDRVLESACVQLAQWAMHPQFAHLTLAVNVSVHQFREADFVDNVLSIIAETGANPRRLKLELTESVLVDNVQDIAEKMSALKDCGVVFSLDDFGIGYSSLSYLKRLPLDQLKIDQSFVRDILIDPNDAVIAKTIVALAQTLGLEVIAEGVETEAQRDFLAEAGCYAYQGYFFCPPLPGDDFEAFVFRSSSRLRGEAPRHVRID